MDERIPYLRWRTHYALGVEKIDEQHRSIVNLINRLHETLQSTGGQAQISSQLDELATELKKHFRTEEKLMEESGYPQRQSHVADHRAIARRLQNFRKEFSEKTKDLTEAFLGEIRDWVRDHMVLRDRSLGTYLASRPKEWNPTRPDTQRS